MAENELKPCKCGSPVELRRGDGDFYIYCPKCKLKTFSERFYDNITDNCDRLLDAWNRRADDGRKELAQSVCDSLREEFYDRDSETDYYAGFDDGLKRAMRLMKAEVRE